jgi:7-keto-8-aminopelargonate synthetase-like enzyme
MSSSIVQRDRLLEQAKKAAGNGSSWRNRAPRQHAIRQLKDRILDDRVTQLALKFIRRYEDSHLKDVWVDSMDAQRRMTLLGREVINFGSDSLLGLDWHPRVQQAIKDALPVWGTHNGTSRAFTSVALCAEAERKLAKWLGVEATLIFPSVTLANMGLLPGIARKNDLLVVDRTSHETLHEAAKVAAAEGAKIRELNPCCPDELRSILKREDYEYCVLAVDGVYSMSGGVPPLRELNHVVRQFGGIMYCDDAHGTAVVGPKGRGACYQALGTLDEVLMVGSLSKAFSCLGAFVTCDLELQEFLKFCSSTFTFGGPVPPPYLAGVCAVCDLIETPEYNEIVGRLRSRMDQLMAGLRSIDVKMAGGEGAVASITVGDIEKTLLAGKFMFDRGFYVQSATYPAVPIMSGILRIQVNANHSEAAVDELLNAFADLKTEFNLPAAS